MGWEKSGRGRLGYFLGVLYAIDVPDDYGAVLDGRREGSHREVIGHVAKMEEDDRRCT